MSREANLEDFHAIAADCIRSFASLLTLAVSDVSIAPKNTKALFVNQRLRFEHSASQFMLYRHIHEPCCRTLRLQYKDSTSALSFIGNRSESMVGYLRQLASQTSLSGIELLEIYLWGLRAASLESWANTSCLPNSFVALVPGCPFH
jgi:hypothetical protein